MAEEEKPQEKPPFSELLPKITTKGDIGAAGVRLAIGYFVDAALHPFGIPPGTASLYSAAAAVGLKNILQAWRDSRRGAQESDVSQKKAEDQAASQHQRLKQASERVLQLLTSSNSQGAHDALVRRWDFGSLGSSRMTNSRP